MTSYVRHIIYGKMTVFSPRCIYAYLLILLLYGLAVTSCGDSKRTVYEKAIIEWTGKEIIFPDSMRLVGGGMIAKPETDFTIVSYYDSVGCTGCRMKLNFWNEFMNRVDSIRGDKTVSLIMIAATKDETELEQIRRRDNFRYLVILDSIDMVNHLNEFPQEKDIQTFLLDHNNHVLTFGNPIMNRGTAKLFLSLIGDSSSMQGVDSDILEFQSVAEHNFGKVKAGIPSRHLFVFKNDRNDTIRIDNVEVSCECTKGDVKPNIIPPHSAYTVDVSFQDTVSGEFLRSVTVNFTNDKIPPLRIEVTGEVFK